MSRDREVIPDIDIGALGRGGAARVAAVEALARACREVGCFAVRVPDKAEALARAYAQSRRFHGQAAAWKERYRKGGALHVRGWVARGTEPAYEPGTASRCESFDVGFEGQGGLNPWPDLSEFRTDVYGWFEAAWGVSRALFGAFAEILGLPAGYFDSRSTAAAPATLRLLYYAATPQEPRVAAREPVAHAPLREVGIAAHTDFECFTIMHQTAPGLEVATVDGAWIDAPVAKAGLDDRLLVILGDMLERWSNGALRATPHRVRETPAERHAIVLFCPVDADVVVAPLPGFVSETVPARYAPVTQGAHLDRRVLEAVATRDEGLGRARP